MDKRIIISKIPGKQRGFNYIMQCTLCSVEFKLKGIHYNDGKGLFCGRSCAMKYQRQSNPDWKPSYKTGKSMKNGYIYDNDLLVYEHRHVMERHIGRKLAKDEHVHHINKDRTDNRIENLELLTKSEHQKHHATESFQTRRRDKLGRWI